MARTQLLDQDELTIVLDEASYRTIRHRVRDACGPVAELAAGEVLANSLEHGNDSRVCVSIRPKTIVLLVSNDVPGKLSISSNKPSGTGGRGLHIIQKLASTGAIRRYDCTIRGTQHMTRLVLDRAVAQALEEDELLAPALLEPA